MKVFTAVLDQYTFAMFPQPRLVVAESRDRAIEILSEMYDWSHNDGVWRIRELSLDSEGVPEFNLKFHESMIGLPQKLKTHSKISR